jgi:hypothetical protein
LAWSKIRVHSLWSQLIKIGHDLLSAAWTDRGLVYIVCVYIYIATLKNGAVSRVNTTLFLTLHEHNLHWQQQELSEFLMRYSSFSCLLLCRGTSLQDGFAAVESFLCAPY